jgi:hypothetical protein
MKNLHILETYSPFPGFGMPLAFFKLKRDVSQDSI